MRKRFIAVFVAVMLLGCLPGAAEAEEAVARETLRSGDWFYFLLEDGSAELVDYNGLAGDIVIPNELDGHPIMAVSTNPFQLLLDNYTVAVSQSHPYLATIDGVLFGKADRKLICFPKKQAAESYEIPQGILKIGHCAFYGCKSLKDVIIPDSVTGIGDYAFFRCVSLTGVTIPDSVTGIGIGAFGVCSSLTHISVSEGNRNYCQLDGVLFDREMQTLICYPAGKTQAQYTIPDSVTSIGEGAFVYCDSLTDVTIPNSMTSIGEFAFFGCSSLTSVTIPDSVTSIGERAFAYCDSLTVAVNARSYAEQYCRENGLQYTAYDPDLEDAPTDWLTGTP